MSGVGKEQRWSSHWLNAQASWSVVYSEEITQVGYRLGQFAANEDNEVEGPGVLDLALAQRAVAEDMVMLEPPPHAMNGGARRKGGHRRARPHKEMGDSHGPKAPPIWKPAG